MGVTDRQTRTDRHKQTDSTSRLKTSYGIFCVLGESTERPGDALQEPSEGAGGEGGPAHEREETASQGGGAGGGARGQRQGSGWVRGEMGGSNWQITITVARIVSEQEVHGE